MSETLRGRFVCGTFMHAPQAGTVEALVDALIEIGADGRIAAIHPAGHTDRAAAEVAAGNSGRLTRFAPTDIIIPGFVDLHVHAPQYPQLGLALDEPLEVWLGKYTFPLEARYADLDFARDSYDTLVGDLLRNGTTTALYFATVHQEATQLLVDICLERGQRALVGKVAMDDPESCPDYYRDASAAAGVAGTRAVIDYVRSHPDNREQRVLPVVTPRFIPSCTDDLLEGLGQLAGECGCHVQTHCSESDWAHGYVLDRHGMSDTESLDRFGLVGRHSVLAHATRLTGSDTDLVISRQAAVAHCPLSNAYFGDAVFPLRAALEKGMHVGLGTDISGGPTASVLESARMAMAASRLLESGTDPDLPRAERGRPNSRIDYRTAFYLATAGGGVALDLPIGQFAPGYHFDALRIDTAAPEGTIRSFGETDPDQMLQKLIHSASRANIADVWVGGMYV
ncbi:guanine deaminase [Devosia sp.]|uniref:guanine deaminase n=1 Tax=Devosia sp. TaxID=1871048 RepID=UPI003A9309C7